MKLLAFLSACALCWAQDDGQWTSVANAHFEVYSQASADDAARALLWFEKLRSFVQQGGLVPGLVQPADSAPLLRIIGFRSEQEYGRYRLHSGADAYYLSAAHRHFIVMPSLETRRFSTAAHEYAHFAIGARGLKLPAWLNEGLAEYLSTVQFAGRNVAVGGDLPARAQTLANSTWLPFDDLLDLTVALAERRSHRDVEIFYAESWALSQMLLTAPSYRDRFAAFIACLNGSTSKACLAEVYNTSSKAVFEDLRGWFAARRTPKVTEVQPLESAPPSSKLLSSDESVQLLTDLLMATGNVDLARLRYSDLAKRAPHNPDLHAALGAIAYDRGETALAISEWRQAIAGGSNDADLCFRYVLTAEEAGLPKTDLRAALQRAIQLRPSFDDARFKLALLEFNAGNYSDSVDQLRAMKVPPGDRAFAYWTALASALTELDNRPEAIAAAHKAESLAKTPSDRENAHRLALMAATDLKVQMIRDSDGQIQMSTTRVIHGATGFNPFIEPSDRILTAQGELSQVLCTAGKLTGFRLTTPTGPINIEVGDPTHVLIENGPNEFYCGAQKRVTVKVDYVVFEKKNLLRGMTFLNSR